MQSNQERIIKRYSTAFKHKVVNEIESGRLSISGAQKLYSIGGSLTIQKWIKKLGKLHLLNKIVRVELKDEISKLKELEKRNKELESALANAHIKIVTYETLIEVAEEELGVDIKKNLKSEQLKSGGKSSKDSKRKGN